MSNRVQGKVAVVTGAARGIGRASVIALAREGAAVVGIDIAGPVSSILQVVPATPDELEETGRLVQQEGRKWLAIHLDQRDISALYQAAEQVRNQFGGLDILFANAGIQAFKPLLEMMDEEARAEDVQRRGARSIAVTI